MFYEQVEVLKVLYCTECIEWLPDNERAYKCIRLGHDVKIFRNSKEGEIWENTKNSEDD